LTGHPPECIQNEDAGDPAKIHDHPPTPNPQTKHTMKTTSLVKVLGIATLAAAASIATSQAQTLIAHYELQETSLTPSGAVYNGVEDSTGTQVDGSYWAVADLGSTVSGLVGQAGPNVGGDTLSYGFLESNDWGVSTNVSNLLPATGNFAVYVTFKTTTPFTGDQGHLFSNNNGSNAGRANLFVSNGVVGWFQNNGVTLTSTTNVTDGNWYTVGIAREGIRFELILDGSVVATGNSSGAIDTATTWMLGRQRNGVNPFEGNISDVQVYDGYIVIPEPGTFVLLGLGLGALVLVRRRRH
jgi:hypothetical protein